MLNIVFVLFAGPLCFQCNNYGALFGIGSQSFISFFLFSIFELSVEFLLGWTFFLFHILLLIDGNRSIETTKQMVYYSHPIR